MEGIEVRASQGRGVWFGWMTVVLCVFLGLSACSTENKQDSEVTDAKVFEEADVGDREDHVENEAPEVDLDKPLTITFMYGNEERFLAWFKEPLEDAFPNMTVEWIPAQPT